MAYKLLVMAEERWRKLNAPHLLPLVQAKVKFVDGMQQRRNEERGWRKPPDQAAPSTTFDVSVQGVKLLDPGDIWMLAIEVARDRVH